ncbi:hypothetical protein OHA77_13805 [Streptosporangium sp. NBC_01639]|uniref:hypothetical protein n=1 Tax=Streptosporangium sp. NBC_01639 TaxID=2975948 RepID=UPI0038637DB3|nr:hypothetical protein OHA77_13805 [Streptosporangium sp. NBC_01639]
MSDGHGSTPGTPSGWASNQPPPYGNAPGSPWTAPGAPPPPQSPPPPPQQPYGGQAPPQPQAPHDQAPPYHPGPYGGQPHGYRPPPAALRPGIIPLRPLGLGDILDGAIKLIRSNPKTVLGLSVIVAALGAIPVAIGQSALLTGMSAELDGSAAPIGPQSTDFLSQYGGTLISYAVQFIAVTLLTGVLTRILGRAVFGGRTTGGEAWRLTRDRVPTLFGLVVVSMLVMLLPLALIFALLWMLASAGADLGSMVLLGAVLVLGFIAYALFVTTRLALAASVAVLERRGVLASLRRSWTLVNGGFWRTLGILLLTQLIAGLATTALSFPFTLAGAFIGVTGETSTASQIGAAVLIAIGGTIGAMITYPFQAGVQGLLYADRRMRAEAFDLVLQTAAIEQQRQGWVHASADDLWDPSITPAGPGRDGRSGQGAPWSPF